MLATVPFSFSLQHSVLGQAHHIVLAIVTVRTGRARVMSEDYVGCSRHTEQFSTDLPIIGTTEGNLPPKTSQ